MKETVIGISVIVLIILGYLNMPLEWRRHKDIEHGNQIIAQIERYRQQHKQLPNAQNEAELAQLGLVKNKQGWQPAYRRLNDQHYEIIYQDGYTAPYLRWQSQQPHWILTP